MAGQNNLKERLRVCRDIQRKVFGSKNINGESKICFKDNYVVSYSFRTGQSAEMKGIWNSVF